MYSAIYVEWTIDHFGHKFDVNRYTFDEGRL